MEGIWTLAGAAVVTALIALLLRRDVPALAFIVALAGGLYLLNGALAPLAELLQALLASVEAYPVYYLAVAALVALQFGCVIWFLASKRRLAFYILAAAAAVLTVMQLILGGGVGALVYILGPLAAWLMLRRSWSLLR